MRIEIYNMREGYIEVINAVRTGAKSSPRGMPTRELLGAQIVLEDISQSLPYGIGRGVSLPFAAVEAAQLVAGTSHVDLVLRVNPTMQQFTDEGPNGPYFHGAYGPRIREGMSEVVRQIVEDRDTRQGVVNVWHAERDLGIERRDKPCTLSLHFMVRGNKLVLHTTMRSNDVWWGLAYDVFQFTQLQWTVAHALSLEPGRYYHNANSLHAYERDFDDMDRLNVGLGTINRALPVGFGVDYRGKEPVGAFQRAQDRAWMLLTDHPLIGASKSELWYREKLDDKS